MRTKEKVDAADNFVRRSYTKTTWAQSMLHILLLFYLIHSRTVQNGLPALLFLRIGTGSSTCFTCLFCLPAWYVLCHCATVCNGVSASTYSTYTYTVQCKTKKLVERMILLTTCLFYPVNTKSVETMTEDAIIFNNSQWLRSKVVASHTIVFFWMKLHIGTCNDYKLNSRFFWQTCWAIKILVIWIAHGFAKQK